MSKIIFYFIFYISILVNAQTGTSPLTEPIVPNEVKAGFDELILGERDPFRKPRYLEELEEQVAEKNAPPQIITEDEKVEAIRRWPIRDYRLVAIMWNIENPKVIVADKRGTLHTMQKNYRLGNKNGIISSIGEGEMVVVEQGVPVVVKIDKPESNGRGRRR